MKISYNWLKTYLKVELPAADVAALLTDCGLEVEGIEEFQSVKGGLKGLLTGEVKSCMRHPNADKLSLTTVDIGTGALLQIVCGAPNVAEGQKVIVAPVGTTVYPVTGEPFEIKKSKIRGEVSEGMICAEDEIGLGQSHAGILVLPPDAPVGLPASRYFKMEDDQVFEIGLTPNRVDAASHLGVARDLSALINLHHQPAEIVNVVWPEVQHCSRDLKGRSIDVEVLDVTGCPRYSGITIEGVEVAESPEWLRNRLKSIGVGPINNIVDITNFVLHECGQPLHAFDADKITGGKVVVRRAAAGEKFVTLDGVERQLSVNDLMICNTSDSMCIAGVFGGLQSGITVETKTVFIESAYFNPASIRKTGKEHGLKTDASFRFERGADPNITLYALKRAALLIREIAGGKISSDIIDVYPKPVEPASIRLEYAYVDSFTGKQIEPAVIRAILGSLGIEVVTEDAAGCVVRVPTGKVDVTRPVDLVEEVLRIYGYNQIPVPDKLSFSLPAVAGFSDEALQEKISSFLADNGFSELLTNSLTKSVYSTSAGNLPEDAVHLLNPLSQDLGILRQELLHTGLEAIQYNRNRKQTDIRFFEFGKSYHRRESGFHESRHLTLFLSGNRTEESWNGDTRRVDFFLLKGFVQRILQLCGIDVRRAVVDHFDSESISGGTGFRLGERTLVRFGMLKNALLRKFDITSPTCYADFDWNSLVKAARKKPVQVAEIPRFPQVRRDLSMIIAREVEFARIEEVSFRTEKKLLQAVQLFDVYDGEKIEAGKKSYAIAFMLQDEHQTLTDSIIDKTMSRLMVALEKEVGAVIRKQ